MDTAKAMMVTISAFIWVPEFAQDYVRDLRVRWPPIAGAARIARLLAEPSRHN